MASTAEAHRVSHDLNPDEPHSHHGEAAARHSHDSQDPDHVPLPEESCSHEMALSAGPIVLDTGKRSTPAQPVLPADADTEPRPWIVSLDLDPPQPSRSPFATSSNGNRAPPVIA